MQRISFLHGQRIRLHILLCFQYFSTDLPEDTDRIPLCQRRAKPIRNLPAYTTDSASLPLDPLDIPLPPDEASECRKDGSGRLYDKDMEQDDV